jgi:hypothetical protein
VLGEFGRHDHLVQRDERLRVVRLIGSHNPYLQLRDRDVLVPDTPRQKDLWRTLGRPGAMLIDGDVVATWRPRASGRTLTIQVDARTPLKRRAQSALSEQAERWPRTEGLTLDAVLGA